MSNKLKTVGIIALTAVFFIADQILKRLALNIPPNSEFNLIGNWLKFKLTLNSGIAFSFPANIDLIIVLTLLIIVGLVYVFASYYKKRNISALFALALIIFGALSNLLDRIYSGHVVDYLDMKLFTVFNLADIMISIGIIWLAWIFLRKEKFESND